MKNKTKGFSLIELMVVISALSILATVILSSLGGSRNRAADAKTKTTLSSIRNTLEEKITAGTTTDYSVVLSSDPLIARAVTDLVSSRNLAPGTYQTLATNNEYAIVFPLIDTTGYWCVDAIGSSKKVSGFVSELYGPKNCSNIEQSCDSSTQITVSNSDTKVDTSSIGYTGSAIPVYVAPNWTTALAGATWIWSAPTATFVKEYTPTNETATFSRTFVINGIPEIGQLEVAADNGYSVRVNGSTITSQINTNPSNWQTPATFNIASNLVTGVNTIEITAINESGWWTGYTPPANAGQQNPAGVIYKLTTSCKKT